MNHELRRLLTTCRGADARAAIGRLRALGIETVAGFGTADAECAWVEAADYSAWLGDGPEPWRDAGRVVSAAMDAGCDGIFPGSGAAAAELDLVSVATAANLAVIGVDPSRAADVLDRGRAFALARRAGLQIPPHEVVGPEDDEIAAAARVGIPLQVGRLTGATERAVDGFDALTGALSEVGRPAVLVHAAPAEAEALAVVVGERGGRAWSLGVLRTTGGVTWLDPAEGPAADAASRWVSALGLVGVAVVRVWETPDGSAWLVAITPRLPRAYALVERVYGVDLFDLQLRLSTAGATGWAAAPRPSTFGASAEVLAASAGRVAAITVPPEGVAQVDPGDAVARGDVLARVVCVGHDLAAARAELLSAVGRVVVSGGVAASG
ncbi:MAG: biotin carboxylase N-terminal domain-containing protein [Myxococcota bacterium]